MPKILSEDEKTVTYLTDDGRTVTVVKESAERLGVYRPGDLPVRFEMMPTEEEFAAKQAAEEAAERSRGPVTLGEDWGTTERLPTEDEMAAQNYAEAETVYPKQPPVTLGAGFGVAEEVPPPLPPKPGPVTLGEDWGTAEKVPAGARPSAGMPQPSSAQATTPTAGPIGPRHSEGTPQDAFNLYAEQVQSGREAKQQLTDVEAGEAEAVAEKNVAYRKAQEAHEQHIAEVDEKKLQAVEARASSLEADIDKHLDMKVDPDRYWSSQSTGNKIVAGIGLLLSSLGQGMTGGDKNVALEMIMKAIDDDVALQMEEIKRAGQGIETKRQINEDFLRNADLRTEHEVKYALTALKVRGVMRDIEQIGLDTANDKIRANAEIADGLAGEEYAKNMQQFTYGERAFQAQKAERARQKKARRRAARGAAQARKQAQDRWQKEFDWKKDKFDQQMDMATDKALAEGNEKAAEAAEKKKQTAILHPMTGAVIGYSRFVTPKQVHDDQMKTKEFNDVRNQISKTMAYTKRVRRQFDTNHKWLESTEHKVAARNVRALAIRYVKAMQGSRPSDFDFKVAIEDFGKGAKSIFQRWEPDELYKRWNAELGQAAKSHLISVGIERGAAADYVRSYKQMDAVNTAEDAETSRGEKFTTVLERDILSPATGVKGWGAGLLGTRNIHEGIRKRQGALRAKTIEDALDKALEGDVTMAQALLKAESRSDSAGKIVKKIMAERGDGGQIINQLQQVVGGMAPDLLERRDELLGQRKPLR